MAFAPQTETGLFLTHQDDTAKIWRGWKRTVSWVNDIDTRNRLSGVDTIVKDCSRDAFGVVISSATTTFPNTLPAFEEHTIIRPTDSAPRHRSKLMEPTGTFSVADPQDFIVHDECPNPIMLEWENEFGANEQHLFSFNQEFIEEANEGFSFVTPTTDDIQTVTRTKGRKSETTTQKFTAFDQGLTGDALRALHSLKTSDDVFVWLAKDGTQKIGVTISGGLDTPYNSKDLGNDFTIQIEFPDDFDFFKAKAY